jgi:hypothetical protein
MFFFEGFACSLCVLYGGLGITKLQFFIKKISNFFQLEIFSNFWSSKPWIRSAIKKNAGSGSIKSMRMHNPGCKGTLLFVNMKLLVGADGSYQPVFRNYQMLASK